MARDKINLIEPVLDESSYIAVKELSANTITQANGTEIVGAFGCKDNSLQITVTNSAEAAKKLTIKAGVFDNAILGDKTISVASGKTIVILIENPSRFQQADSSIYIDYETGFTGNIYAVGKHAGLEA